MSSKSEKILAGDLSTNLEKGLASNPKRLPPPFLGTNFQSKPNGEGGWGPFCFHFLKATVTNNCRPWPQRRRLLAQFEGRPHLVLSIQSKVDPRTWRMKTLYEHWLNRRESWISFVRTREWSEVKYSTLPGSKVDLISSHVCINCLSTRK